MNSRRRVFSVVGFASVLAGGGFAAATAPDFAPVEILAQADEQFARGVAALASDRPAAEVALDQSIALYRRLVDERGIRNGGLYYNLGNAHLLRGDAGRAILNYRRAERLMPRDANLAVNLAEARRRTASRVAPLPEAQALRTFLFWHYDLSQRARFGIAAGAAALFWLSASAVLLRVLRARWWWGACGACALVALAFGASVYLEHRSRLDRPEGVVTAPEVIGRKGPDESAYQPSFTEPLGAGVEFRLVERRRNWLLVRLADGRESWIPDTAVDWIDPTAPAGS